MSPRAEHDPLELALEIAGAMLRLRRPSNEPLTVATLAGHLRDIAENLEIQFEIKAQHATRERRSHLKVVSDAG